MDAHPDATDWILRAQLRAVFGGVSDRGDLEDHSPGKGMGSGRWRCSCRGQTFSTAGAAGNGILRSRAMPAVGHGNQLHRVRGMVSGLAEGHLPSGSRDCGRGRQQKDIAAAAYRSQPLCRLRSVRVCLPVAGTSRGVRDEYWGKPVGKQPDFADPEKELRSDREN
jgi:hypothetical protein